MLLGNPHLRWQQLYWEAHVKVPGRLDFYGSTLVGYPWLRAGFNDRLGYVQTNNNSDNRDIFALPLDPSRPDHYLFEGKPRPLQRTDVAVEWKQENGTMTVERRTYWRSHLGPIVYRNSTTAFAYRSTVADAWRWFEGIWRLSHARSLRDYMKVMSTRFSPESNYTYADADGNILYLWNSRIPKRVQDGTNYDLDVPGGTKKYVWKDLHPTRDLPQMLNPPGGYIQNANNPPWYVSLRQPLDPARYPAYFERGELALRPQLALDMVEAREKFSVEDLKRLKYDTRLLLAERVKPALLAAIAAQASPSEELAEARQGARGVGQPRVGGQPRRGAVRAVLERLSHGGRAAVCRTLGREAAGRDAARHCQSRGGAQAPGRGGEVGARHARLGGRRVGRREPVPVRRHRPAGRRRERPVRARTVCSSSTRPGRRTAPSGSRAGRSRTGNWRDSAMRGCCSCTSRARCRRSR